MRSILPAVESKIGPGLLDRRAGSTVQERLKGVRRLQEMLPWKSPQKLEFARELGNYR
jgi:hypothetical protein